MKLNILEQQKNVLLHREELSASLTFDAQTPSNADVTKAIADTVKKDAETVVVKRIKTHFGDRSAEVSAYVYYSKEKKAEIEPKKKEKKKKEGEAAPAAPAAPAEAAKDTPKDAPKEDKKEAAPKKAEEKKE
jgi:ribosomal protein S24E